MEKEELIKRAEDRVKFGKEMIKTVANVNEWKKELEYDEAILALIKKEVSEEWKKEALLQLTIIAQSFMNIKGDWTAPKQDCNEGLDAVIRLKQMLEEAGIEIK